MEFTIGKFLGRSIVEQIGGHPFGENLVFFRGKSEIF